MLDRNSSARTTGRGPFTRLVPHSRAPVLELLPFSIDSCALQVNCIKGTGRRSTQVVVRL